MKWSVHRVMEREEEEIDGEGSAIKLEEGGEEQRDV